MKPYTFEYAMPVWAGGREKEKNLSIVLNTVFGPGDAVLRISAHSLYQVFVNGNYVSQGPARAAHGYYRVDELDLSPFCAEKDNELVIIVAGYNKPSYYLLDLPSFVCAELIVDGSAVAFTGGNGFSARIYTERLQNVIDYSFQRTYVEAYSMPSERVDVELKVTDSKRFIEREVPYPCREREKFADVYSRGEFVMEDSEGAGEYDINNDLEARRIKNVSAYRADDPSDFTLNKMEYAILELGKELTGFISFEIETTGGRLIVTFDELIRDGDVPFKRLSTINSVIYDLAPGKYALTGFEPYSLKYLKFSSLADSVKISRPALIRFEFGGNILPGPDFSSYGELSSIYDAAVSTFRQNTVDIYMDCPSRERAGWLCDSFFTSRTEYSLTGKSVVERAFLENFLMNENEDVPKGMLPMCYPSDHRNHVYIPNWAMWYGIELRDYYERTGDRELVEKAKEKIYALSGFFRGFENAKGLLQKLESWVFVEWSHSNDLVQDINYPTNMLYVKFKRSIGELYNDSELILEADRLSETIRNESYRDGWFCDNSVLNENGEAVLSGEITETCQYYAFFTGVATIDRYPDLWNRLLNGFGPKRKKHNEYPEIAFSNAFIGNYLRLELLFTSGNYDKLKEEIKDYFGFMAEKTGTLWENDSDVASCNHGFASYTAAWIRRILR